MALARGLEILRAFDENNILLSNRDFVRITGIPKATVSRLTQTLHALGYLTFDPSIEKFAVSPGILSLSYPVFINNEILLQARPLMERLAQETESTVGLGIRDGTNMIYLEYAKTPASGTYGTAIGFRIPMAGSAMGWAYLATVNHDERESALEQVRKGTKKEHWPVISKRIDEAMREVAVKGFCTSFGDMNPLTNAVGLAFPYQGIKIYGMNCIGPSFRFDRERLDKEIGPKLLKLARRLQSGA